MTALVECVPNFSEGRQPAVLAALAAAISGVKGVKLLHQTADADHHRSVFTFAGPPAPVTEAAFRAIEVAARLIDLTQHRGEHPRLGAADVVPLVPLRDITLAQCAALATDLGQRVGTALQLPVYLYEAAATRPERVNLADVRRGQYEALRDEITQPARQPDFGPAQVGPAGAVIIGARQFLVAFNVYLHTDDVSIARQIAAKIRMANGGLPGVKALGFRVQGRAQVSLNIVHFTRFPARPLPHIVAIIQAEAEQRGTGIEYTELIGLIPQHALTTPQRAAEANMTRYTVFPETFLLKCARLLHLRDFTPERVLEVALRRARL
ncbi:MAG: glutamate formimidoyltransferase [Anaerolineae bacterium]|nr:glutamate formimidoyltransferase [Anaerolineae bacterium]